MGSYQSIDNLTPAKGNVLCEVLGDTLTAVQQSVSIPELTVSLVI